MDPGTDAEIESPKAIGGKVKQTFSVLTMGEAIRLVPAEDLPRLLGALNHICAACAANVSTHALAAIL